MAPLESWEDALGKSQGLKRLVKGDKKRSRTPEGHEDPPKQSERSIHCCRCGFQT